MPPRMCLALRVDSLSNVLGASVFTTPSREEQPGVWQSAAIDCGGASGPSARNSFASATRKQSRGRSLGRVASKRSYVSRVISASRGFPSRCLRSDRCRPNTGDLTEGQLERCLSRVLSDRKRTQRRRLWVPKLTKRDDAPSVVVSRASRTRLRPSQRGTDNPKQSFFNQTLQSTTLREMCCASVESSSPVETLTELARYAERLQITRPMYPSPTASHSPQAMET